MSAAAIVETLAKDFSIAEGEARYLCDALGAGFKAPFLARFRHVEIGRLPEGTVRRFDRRRRQLEELERRRASLLRSLAKNRAAGAEHGAAETPPEPPSGEQPGASEDADAPEPVAEAPIEPSEVALPRDFVRTVESCMDRFELEDLFLPHRRPEPEVQLALDRGLGQLADLLVAPAPRARGAGDDGHEDDAASEGDDDGLDEAHAEAHAETSAGTQDVDEPAEEHDAGEEHEAGDEAEHAARAEGADDAPAESPAPDGDSPPDQAAAAPAPRAARAPRGRAGRGGAPAKDHPVPTTKLELTPQLARVCAPFVNPDRDVHTDEQALEGAMRILADRLGRNPRLRIAMRRIVRKHGRVNVRALADDKKLGRHRALLRIHAPIAQIQGHRLVALRQAQIQRLVTTSISVDPRLALPKVRNALGKRIQPEFANVADVVAEQALYYRLLPMIEDDVRHELRERADEEAIRFLAQHLRHILLAPPFGRRNVAGLDVNAKGDWTIVVVGADGNPVTGEIKIEAGGKEPAELGTALGDALRGTNAYIIAVGHGKGSRETVHKLRTIIALLGVEDAQVLLANEVGLSAYASSEPARTELPEHSVPARMAISLARRLQDPLGELLKTDPRHLGLGKEQSVVSKANLRRVLHDTLESCVAYVGCDVNHAPLHVLRFVPGLDFNLARAIVERRAERPFASRQELLDSGVLDEVRWTNAIGFLRVPESEEPLDRTNLHPDQYAAARRLAAASGSSIEELAGRRDGLKGLRRADFEIDEWYWRDLQRELTYPGRDPRPRLLVPRLLPPDGAEVLERDRVVEGLVSNVASFGVFVDLGIPRDGMVHISEVSDRYVRDARGLLSIGQFVRARVLDASGQRVELSLKSVPDRRREERGPRPPRRERRDDRRGGARGAGEEWPELQPVLRAARTRRDGLVTGKGRDDDRRRRGGAGGGGRGRGGGGFRGGRGGRPGGGGRGRDEGYDPDAVRRVAQSGGGEYNPFAAFFRKQRDQP